MGTLTISFNPNESNAEVLAQVVRLLGAIEADHQPASISEVIERGISVKPQKTKKSRKPLTEEQKAAVRARFIEGKRKAAIARGEIIPEPVKAKSVKVSKAITPGTPESDAKIKASIKKSNSKAKPDTR